MSHRVVLGAVVGIGVSAMNYKAQLASKFKPVEVSKEYEHKKRSAKVYVFIRDIEGLKNIQSEMFKHWTIVIEFINGSWRSADAQETDGRLQAYYSKEKPEECDNGELHYLGNTRILPYEFRELVTNNKLNGTKYFMATHNCQDWVIELAENLGEYFGRKIKKFNTFKNSNPILAYGCSFVSAMMDTLHGNT